MSSTRNIEKSKTNDSPSSPPGFEIGDLLGDEPTPLPPGSALRNEPVSRATTSTTLCKCCGNKLVTKLRVRSSENIRVFRSGYLPSLSEHTLIGQLIDEAEEDRKKYVEELERLQMAAAQLANKQKTLDAYIADLRCAVAPIRKMPPELLGEVFKSLCCGSTGTNVVTKKDPYLQTVVLSHVCSRWRTIVQSMPALWSSIIINTSKTGTSDYLEHYLVKSESYPLDFVVASRDTSTEDIISLLNNSDRWRSAQFGLSHSRLGIEVFHHLNEEENILPELVSLTIDNDRESLPGRESYLPVGCPKLQHISVSRFDLNLLYPRPSIQKLNLVELTGARLHHLLENSPNLESAIIRRSFNDIDSGEPLVSLLKNLTLGYAYSGEAEESLLEVMTLPCLTSLTLLEDMLSGPDIVPHNAEPILGMFQRSGCQLTHLTIHITLEDDEVLDILRVVPTVTHLSLREYGSTPMVTDKLLMELTVDCSSDSVGAGVTVGSAAGNSSRGDLPDEDNSAGGGTTSGLGDGTDDDAAEGDLGTSAGDANGSSTVTGGITSNPNSNPSSTNTNNGTDIKVLLPSLIDLSLDVQPSFKDQVLLNFISSRWTPSVPLSLNPPSSSSSASPFESSSQLASVACLQKITLKRATGALYDQLRKDLEVIGRQGLCVGF